MLPAPERRLAAGDPDALGDCYQTYGGLVRRSLTRFVRPDDLDDVVQRVFWEVWRCRTRYDPDRSFEAWILDIARKRAIDHLRARRADTVDLDHVAELCGSDGRDTADRSADARLVNDALARLPQNSRTVLQLAYFDGYTQREIAVLLDLPLGTVKTRTSRGLTRLAALLADTGYREGSPVLVTTRPSAVPDRPARPARGGRQPAA